MPVLSCVPVKDYSDKMESRDAPVKGEAEEGGVTRGVSLRLLNRKCLTVVDQGGNYRFCHICLLNPSSIEARKRWGRGDNATTINLLVALIRFRNLSILKC